MPELPEVEITKRSIETAVIHQTITAFDIHQKQLRWRIDSVLSLSLPQQKITQIDRVGKYLLFKLSAGETLIIHLGMSGKMRLASSQQPLQKHEHWVMHFDGLQLRYNDPRRFGCLLCTEQPMQHALIKNLGVEPLTANFTGELLYQKSRRKTQAIKSYIMDSHIVMGIGNIYANESLFLAGLHPATPVNNLNLQQYTTLCRQIKLVLQNAIQRGGSSLKDFADGAGNSGYFQLSTNVYGRSGQSCTQCGTDLKSIRQLQRISVYCPNCQKQR